MKRIWDAIVVGAGPAGCTASIQLVREGFSTLLIEKEPKIGGLVRHAWRVENCPLFKNPIPGLKIASALEKNVKMWGVKLIKADVNAISKTEDGLWLVCADDLKMRAKAVLVCVGTMPKQLDVAVPKNVKLRFYPCEIPRSAKKVAIVGGGDAAFDYAMSLKERKIDPIILVRSNKPRALKRLQDEVKSHSIKVFLDSKITEVEKIGRSVKICIQTRGRIKKILADELLIAIGRTSAIERINLDVELKRSDKSGLLCSGGLWLCGDVWRGKIRQMSIAIGDGLAGAMEAAEFLRTRG